MARIELIIGKVVDLGRSHLGDNSGLHTGTRKLLTDLEMQIPRIQSVIEAANKQQMTNNWGPTTWLEQLKDAAYEAEDVLDDFEAKRIRVSLKGKGKVSEIGFSSRKMVKNLFFPDRELKELKYVVNKLHKLCMHMGDFIPTLQHYERKEHLYSHGRETSSAIDPGKAIFGRDTEIDLILDMISNVLYGDFNHKALDDHNLQQGEGEGEGSNSLSDKIFKNFLNWGIPGKLMFIRTVIKGDVLEQSQKGFLGLSKSGKSMFSETVKKGDAPQQIKNRLTTIETSFLAKHHSISTQKLAVIPIVGVGGVGKTAVAKRIYNHERVKEYFPLKAWVYVSEKCDAMKIMQKILGSFRGHIIDPLMNLDIVENMLIETIKNQRFLLTLDDLSYMTEHIWSRLLSVFYYGEVGSVIVVTTQSRSIAIRVETLPQVTLDVLQPESFWELFQYYAFGGSQLGEWKMTENLKLIGKKIAEKLNGLPLAGEVIGTILSMRLESEFWEDIRRSDWWNIEGAREKILPSIGVGYNDLHRGLKQCFAFCSIFPKHYVFERERLIQMWIAHGFIQPGKEETSMLDKGEFRLEDIGRKWFGELVDRSFFQPTLSDGKYFMHALVRDLSIAVSSNEFCFVKSHGKRLPFLARHLGIDCDNLEVEWKCDNSTRLRTVVLFGNWTNCSANSISNIVAKYNGLHVLDLSYIVLETNEPIHAACQLLHLRFVDLSFTGIKSIPDEFCALCHLQVLDVRGCNFEKLPKGMNKLINLRHLYASSDTISLISGIGKLNKLQELEEFRIGESKGHGIGELKDMNEISGHLLLSKLQNVSSEEEAGESKLEKKKHLKSLELRWDYNDNHGPRTEVKMEILDALKPPPSLEILKVRGCNGGSLPGWVCSSNPVIYNLRVIHVSHFQVRSLPAFGGFPFLEILIFDDLPLIEKVGSEFYGSSNVVLPSLKELIFSRMSFWITWEDGEVGKTIFPHLKNLYLKDCQALMALPMYSLTSVVDLTLSECRDLRNIQTVLERMPSLAHFSIIGRQSVSIDCTHLKSLEVLHLKNIHLVYFVGGVKNLVKLREVVIKNSQQIRHTYEEDPLDEISHEEYEKQYLQSLTYLHLYNSERLPRLGRLPFLRTLLIEKSFLSYFTEDQWFNQLTSLEKLEFRNCQQLSCLPSTLHLLTSLKKLHISSCPELCSLPEEGLPPNLAELFIKECPYIISRCQPNQGDDWYKISHIPFVHFDEEMGTT